MGAVLTQSLAAVQVFDIGLSGVAVRLAAQAPVNSRIFEVAAAALHALMAACTDIDRQHAASEYLLTMLTGKLTNAAADLRKVMP